MQANVIAFGRILDAIKTLMNISEQESGHETLKETEQEVDENSEEAYDGSEPIRDGTPPRVRLKAAFNNDTVPFLVMSQPFDENLYEVNLKDLKLQPPIDAFGSDPTCHDSTRESGLIGSWTA